MHWIALRPPAEATAADRLALGWALLAFTPRVARVDEAVLLEVSASLRLFGGPAGLRQRLRAAVAEHHPPDRPMAWAAGASAAWALGRARCGQPRAPLAALPLASLSAAQPHLAVLERIGCQTWGDLRRLPRDGVARRFGAPLLDALDQAWGQRPEALDWLVLPPVFDATLDLDRLVHDAPALMFGAQRLLGRLRAWLQGRGAGVCALRLGWRFDARRGLDRPGDALVLRLAEPAQDLAHLARLLAEHLAHTRLAAPVQQLQLATLDVVALPGTSRSLLPEPAAQGEGLPQLIERLGARLGPAQVRRWQPAAHPLPERMQAWVASEARPPRPDATRRHAEALWPPWLLEVPLPLAQQGRRPVYQGPLQLLAGPQRLEASVWAGETASGLPAARDYCIAHSAGAGLLWIFRERTGGEGRWYLHGFFG